MENLPIDTAFQIPSIIPYQDLLALPLDAQVIRQLKSISSVRICERSNSFAHLDPLKYQFDLNQLEIIVDEDFDLAKLLKWVKKTIPSLQAIELYHFGDPVKLSLLLPFAKQLKYFNAVDVEVDVHYWSAQHIMDMFPALQFIDVAHHDGLFCPRVWSERSNFIRWLNKCDHKPRCKGVGGTPTATDKWVELDDYHADWFDFTAVASSLEVLIIDEISSPPLDLLHFPQLKCFKLDIRGQILEVNMLANFLGDAPNLRLISIYADYGTKSVPLTLISLVNSLPEIETVEFYIKAPYEFDPDEPKSFIQCEKRRPSKIYLHFDTCTTEHFALIRHLLSSSVGNTSLLITTFWDIGLDLQMDYMDKKSLHIDAGHASYVKQLLDALPSRYFSLTKKLQLSTKDGLDASFAEFLLKFDNLEDLSGKFTEDCIQHWLPSFTLSNNKKHLQLFLKHLGTSHTVTPGTHDLLIKSKENGSLEKIGSDWLCPMDDSCTCGLRRHRT